MAAATVVGPPSGRSHGRVARPGKSEKAARQESQVPWPWEDVKSLPAEKFRIPDRGLLAPGKVADVVAFEAETIRDVGDYRDPVHSPEGIRWVMQAGQLVVENGRFLGRRAGTRLTPDDTSRS